MALTDNLVSFWKLDEGSGDAYDSFGLHKAVNSNVTYGTGKINNCAIFNSTTDKLSVASTTALNPTGAFSFSFWVYINSLPTTGNITNLLCKYDGAPDSGGYDVRILNSSGVYKLAFFWQKADTSNTGIIDQTYTLSTGQWLHMVCVYNSTTSTAKIYLNSTEILSASATGAVRSTTKSLVFGNFGYYSPSSADLARPLDGNLDEIGYWSRALTTTEIAELYNSGAGKSWPFLTNGKTNIFGKGRLGAY